MNDWDVVDIADWIVMNCDGNPNIPLLPQYADDFEKLRQDKSGLPVVVEAQRLLALTERCVKVAAEPGRSKHLRGEIRSNYAKIFVAIGRRDGFGCYVCGASPRDLQIDHYLPIAMGGTNDLGNLRLCCPQHNMEKGLDVPEGIEL